MPERTALEGIARLESFFGSLGLTPALRAMGVADDRLAEMADKCTKQDWNTVGNFVKLRKAEVLDILRAAY